MGVTLVLALLSQRAGAVGQPSLKNIWPAFPLL